MTTTLGLVRAVGRVDGYMHGTMRSNTWLGEFSRVAFVSQKIEKSNFWKTTEDREKKDASENDNVTYLGMIHPSGDPS